MTRIKTNKNILGLNVISLLLFIMTSVIASSVAGLTSNEFFNKLVYGVILYVWASWVYVGKRKFYRFFMTFVLSVYTFGFISYLFVTTFSYLNTIQIVLSCIGIVVNIFGIYTVQKKKLIKNVEENYS